MRWEDIGKQLLQFCANPQKASDAEFLSDPAIVKATHGDYQHPQSYLGKAWIIFKLRGPLALVREARSYLWWRLIGPD